jgi:sulfoxide reductase heme-binding subunit YedZ
VNFPLFELFQIGVRRWLTHTTLALAALIACYLAHLYAPYAALNYALTIGCGYLALILIMLTLLIGPVQLLYQSRNPVNLDLRRDIGIWAGITGCIHVMFGLQIHMNGRILNYFIQTTGRGYRLLLNAFGISNHLGLLATVILIMLLVLSNDISLKRLKGKRWKLLQRFNYLLALLVFVHTFLYQMISQREQPFRVVAFCMALILIFVQTLGFLIYRSRTTFARHRVHGYVLHREE